MWRKRELEVGETDAFRENIRESRRIFLEHVWPLWADDLAATQIISTEDSERPFEREADLSGTDAFFIRNKTGVLIPLASRVEFFEFVKDRGLGKLNKGSPSQPISKRTATAL